MSDERDDAAAGSNDPGDSDDATTPTSAAGAGDVGSGAAADADGRAVGDTTGSTASMNTDEGTDTDEGAGTDEGTGAATAPAKPTGKRRAGETSAQPRAARRSAAGSKAEQGRITPRRVVAEAPSRGGPVTRVTRFLREVVAELRKVIWPTRKQLVTYTGVVLVFVSFMVALVSGLDIAFARGVLWIFG